MSTKGHATIQIAKLYTWIVNSGYKTRKLNSEERNLAKAFFGDSVDLDKVEVAEKASGAGDRAFVAGNTIYIGMSPRSATPTASDDYWETFVHEMMHVWQYQAGGNDYILTAGIGQFFQSRRLLGKPPTVGDQPVRYSNDAYDYISPLVGGYKWSAFGAEAQAELVSDLWKRGYLAVENGLMKCKPSLSVSAEVRHCVGPRRQGACRIVRLTRGHDGWGGYGRSAAGRVNLFLSEIRSSRAPAVKLVPAHVMLDKAGRIIDNYD
jgi:hypothetical protein